MKKVGIAFLLALVAVTVAFALPAAHQPLLWQSSTHDGISLNFCTTNFYTKVPGGSARRGAFTDFFTFTRAAPDATFVGANGLVQTATTNIPRVEYDLSGNCLGLLVEASRQNLGLHSADLTNAAWVKVTATTAMTATGPDGATNSATTLTATAGNGTALQAVVSASATRAYSVWLKRRTGTGNIDLTLDAGVGWSTQAITSSWAKYSITQAAVTNPTFGVRIVTNADAVDVWGSQLESAAFASSSIPTGAAAVTRAADSAIRTLGSEFSATAGTVVVVGRASGGQDAAVHQHVFGFDDNTNQEMFRLLRQVTADTAVMQIMDGGVEQASMNATFVNSTAFKSAVVWAANDGNHYFNGALASSGAPDATVTLPTVTQLGLGRAGFQTTTAMNGHILRFDYYPERKANDFLILKSTPGPQSWLSTPANDNAVDARGLG